MTMLNWPMFDEARDGVTKSPYRSVGPRRFEPARRNVHGVDLKFVGFSLMRQFFKSVTFT